MRLTPEQVERHLRLTERTVLYLMEVLMDVLPPEGQKDMEREMERWCDVLGELVSGRPIDGAEPTTTRTNGST
jgi:hypothetical protein